MFKEFTNSVQRLFEEIVTDKSQCQSHDANDLLAVLQRKVTLPIGIARENGFMRLTYYNVSVIVKDDLSALYAMYNSDYSFEAKDLSTCDLHQLSEFVLALEREIPQWHHLWLADDKLRKEKARVSKRVESMLQNLRTKCISRIYALDNHAIEELRIKYYNAKAAQLLLDNDIPYWENKPTEKEIIKACLLYHINPPVSEWYDDFEKFMEQCRKARDARDQAREEMRRQLQKQNHLINLKKTKIEAFISTVELHSDFQVEVSKRFNEESLAAIKYGCFSISFSIMGCSRDCYIHYENVDSSIPPLMNAIKRINDCIPELCGAFSDGDKCRPVVDSVFPRFRFNSRTVGFSIGRYNNRYGFPEVVNNHPATPIIDKINTIITQFRDLNDAG